jgi:hypothetical protein
MKHRGYAISIGLLVLCLLTALFVNRLTRRAQSQSPWLSPARLTEFASLDPIDAHTHISQTGPAFVGMLERLHLRVLDILYVDDTDPYRSSTEPQKQDALRFMASSPGHAQLCTTFDPFQFNKANFSRDAIEALNQDFARGAVAAKIWKNIGMEIKDASGKYVMPDDPRFEPIYRDIAAHHKTLVSHMAEVDDAWESHDREPLSAKYFAENPQWDMSRKQGAPEKENVLQARDHLLATNPDLRVVGAHLGCMDVHLDDLATRLDLYPNFAVDTAARVRRLVLQPREKVLAFILKYQDRILYGTDMHFYARNTDQEISQVWERQYARDWRYFATDDSFEYEGHKVEGLNLSLSVLKKLYHDNAVHWIPGIDANLR